MKFHGCLGYQEAICFLRGMKHHGYTTVYNPPKKRSSTKIRNQKRRKNEKRKNTTGSWYSKKHLVYVFQFLFWWVPPPLRGEKIPLSPSQPTSSAELRFLYLKNATPKNDGQKKEKTRFGVRWNQWSLISKRARWFLTWPFVGAVSSVTLLGKFLDWWPPTIIFRGFFARSRRPKKITWWVFIFGGNHKARLPTYYKAIYKGKWHHL